MTSRAPTVISYTRQVEDYLRREDDFRTAAQIRNALSLSKNRVSAALIHLRAHGVADAEVAGGVLWWYARPPEDDDRSRTLDEHVEEIRKPNRRPRRAAAPADQSGSGLY